MKAFTILSWTPVKSCIVKNISGVQSVHWHILFGVCLLRFIFIFTRYLYQIFCVFNLSTWEQVLQRLYSSHFFPIFPFYTPENIRKPLVFWCFPGVKKGNIGKKWVNIAGIKTIRDGTIFSRQNLYAQAQWK